MKVALGLIEETLSELRNRTDFSFIKEKAVFLRLNARYEISIDRLNLSEKHKITGGSIILKIPDFDKVYSYYKVVDGNESSYPCNWEELLFEKRQPALECGDLVIKL